MCTVNAAKAYGLPSLGSIEAGKKGDIIVVRPAFRATPYSGSIYGYIVNGIRGADVRDAVVDGEVVMRNRKLQKVDLPKAEIRVMKTMGKLWRRLGPSPSDAEEPWNQSSER